MLEKEYERVMLFMGVLSVKGFPEEMKERLEREFGPIALVSEPFPFSFTDYYVPEMGEGIQRFFVAFRNLITPDQLASAKKFTNALELEWEE
ncbi:MAG: DUF4416 family protein, partial [Spirochaetales bacterium]|nr:DUF4416 family protein [Candidatus Physcosoma equi]